MEVPRSARSNAHGMRAVGLRKRLRSLLSFKESRISNRGRRCSLHDPHQHDVFIQQNQTRLRFGAHRLWEHRFGNAFAQRGSDCLLDFVRRNERPQACLSLCTVSRHLSDVGPHSFLKTGNTKSSAVHLSKKLELEAARDPSGGLAHPWPERDQPRNHEYPAVTDAGPLSSERHTPLFEVVPRFQ